MIFLVHLVTNCIINAVLFDYLNQNYEKKHIIPIYLGLFIMCTITISYINLLTIPLLNLMVNLILFICISVYGYEHESIRNYFEDMIYLFILFFLDSISYFFVGFIYNSTENIHIFRMLSSSLIVLFLNVTIKKYVLNTKVENILIKELILYFIITVFYLFLIYIMSKRYDSLYDMSLKRTIVFIVIGHVLIDLLIYYYLDYVGKVHKMEKNIIESNKQIELKNLYYKGLKKNYEENRKIIHDLKNYLQVLETSYENNIKNGKKIKTEIIKRLDSKKMKYNTSSEILDIILMDKDKEAKNKNIDFIFKMEVIDLNFISELDTITIFGNLYDNAIEANEIIYKNKYIKTAIYQVNQMIVIRIENSCKNNIEYIGEKIKTTKKEHDGIGIGNIKRTLKKYNGIFDIKINNEHCSIIITLPSNK